MKIKGVSMSIFDKNLFEQNKLEIAIKRIKEFYFEPYYVCFSGGKDSIVIEKLCKMSGVEYDLHYNLTTVDPPEVIKFIKQNYHYCIINKPKKTMWQLIIEKGLPPTRRMRYCCDHLKERGGEGRFVITGVRWAESTRRKNSRKTVEIFSRSKAKKHLENVQIFLNSDNSNKRLMLESCFSKNKRVLNPIIDWSDDEVWEFIRHFNLSYPKLYDEGFKRIGCIGCPLASNGRAELEKFPKFKNIYIKTFDRMIKKRLEDGKETQWKNGQEVLDWWLPIKKTKKFNSKVQ